MPFLAHGLGNCEHLPRGFDWDTVSSSENIENRLSKFRTQTSIVGIAIVVGKRGVLRAIGLGSTSEVLVVSMSSHSKKSRQKKMPIHESLSSFLLDKRITLVGFSLGHLAVLIKAATGCQIGGFELNNDLSDSHGQCVRNSFEKIDTFAISALWNDGTNDFKNLSKRSWISAVYDSCLYTSNF